MGKRRPEEVTLQDTQDAGAFPVVPMLAGLAAAAVGVAAWVGLFFGQIVWLAPLGIGALVGLAIMFTDKKGDKRLPWVAAGLTVLSCWVGYVIVDQFFYWQQTPPLGRSIFGFVRNMQSALLSLIGGYMAWVVAGRAGKTGAGSVT